MLGSEAERDWLLKRYRLAQFAVCRALQPRHLRLQQTWPLRLSAAPEPSDIAWSYFSDARCLPPAAVWQYAVRVSTVTFLLVLFLLGSGGCLLIFAATLGVPGESAMQCDIWSSQDASLAAWNSGCSCLCACDLLRSQIPDTSLCKLQEVESSLAVLACVVLVEILQAIACWGLRWLMPFWRAAYASQLEAAKMFLLAAAQVCAPLSPVCGLLALKWLWSEQVFQFQLGAAGANGLRLQQVDISFYKYAIPIILVWCCLRWLAIIPETLRICRRSHATSFMLWKQYASVASVVAVTIAFQPFAPCLPCVGFVGALIWYWAVKSVIARGAVTVAELSQAAFRFF